MSFIFTVEVFEVVLGSNWLVDGVHSVVVWSGWGEEKIVNGDIICVLSEFVGFCVSIIDQAQVCAVKFRVSRWSFLES
jgi:hypothetical protein